MANLTITVDDKVLKRARIRALEQGTSVNAILAERLRAFAGESDAQLRATAALTALAKENSRRGGKARSKKRGPRRWTRDELHERR
jgi:plasmid stability protein